MAPNPTSSALVPVKVDNDNLVEEKIDERILAILGIGDVFDLTYEEYIGLLKEKSIEYRMTGADVPTESVELITEEFKRVKGKTGKFKVKSQKIDFQKVVNVRAPSPQKAQLDPSKLLPPSKEEEPVEVKKEPSIDDILNFLKGDLLDGLKSIVESLNNINQTLKEQNQIDKKTRESQRKSGELEKKSRRESELESKPGKNKEEEKKLKTPVVSFFDSIKKFVTNVLLGSVVLGLFKWLKDPKNEKAINGFGEFLTDNAPLILGGLLAIAALPLVPTILSLTGTIIGVAIPALTAAFGFLTSPVGLAALAAIAAGTTIYGLTQASKSFEEQAAAMSDEELDKQTKRLQSIVSKQEEQGYQSQGESSKDKNYLRALEAEQDKRERVRKKTAFGQENIDKALKRFEQIKTSGSGEKIKIPGVGTMQAGRSFLGTPQVKYFDESGNQILKNDFDKILNETISQQSLVKPQTSKTSDYVSPFSGARDREALKASKITGNTPITIGEKAGYSSSRGRVHAGRDISAPSGTGLQVPSDSIITDKGVDSGYGNYVVFKDSSGIEHLYGHMLEATPYNKGDEVSAGTVIGRVGSTGRSTGPHLHWEVSRKMGEVGRPRANIIDPIEMGFPAQAPFTGKVEAAQLAQTKPSVPSIPSPSGRSNITMLPLATGASSQQVSSGTSPNQAPVPNFSSEDPNNMTMLTVKAIYNVVG